MTRCRVPLFILAAAVGLSLSGCSALGPSAQQADAVAAQFVSAISGSDGNAACALLNDEAVKDVEAQTRSACAEGILTLGLPGAGAPQATEVFGRSALVRLDTNSLFLTVGGSSWLIRAAGCEPRTDAPFECVIDGS